MNLNSENPREPVKKIFWSRLRAIRPGWENLSHGGNTVKVGKSINLGLRSEFVLTRGITQINPIRVPRVFHWWLNDFNWRRPLDAPEPFAVSWRR